MSYFFSACNKGFYGVDCNEECGHCRDVNKCHHINGTCLNGCAAGFMGNLCLTGSVDMYVVKMKMKFLTYNEWFDNDLFHLYTHIEN